MSETLEKPDGTTTPAEAADISEPEPTKRPRRWRRALKRTAIALGVTVGVLLVLAGLLYLFGGMERPAPAFVAAYEQLVADGQAAPAQGRFVIPIPGCRCHSGDPIVQVEHSAYRVRDCMRCH